jgi:hypothetical protein
MKVDGLALFLLLTKLWLPNLDTGQTYSNGRGAGRRHRGIAIAVALTPPGIQSVPLCGHAEIGVTPPVTHRHASWRDSLLQFGEHDQ